MDKTKLLIPLAFVLTYIGFWEFIYLLGVENIPPIGYRDQFGLIFPPKWIVLPTVLLTMGEYFIAEILFSHWKEKWKISSFETCGK